LFSDFYSSSEGIAWVSENGILWVYEGGIFKGSILFDHRSGRHLERQTEGEFAEGFRCVRQDFKVVSMISSHDHK